MDGESLRQVFALRAAVGGSTRRSRPRPSTSSCSSRPWGRCSARPVREATLPPTRSWMRSPTSAGPRVLRRSPSTGGRGRGGVSRRPPAVRVLLRPWRLRGSRASDPRTPSTCSAASSRARYHRLRSCPSIPSASWPAAGVFHLSWRSCAGPAGASPALGLSPTCKDVCSRSTRRTAGRSSRRTCRSSWPPFSRCRKPASSSAGPWDRSASSR
jgi:hypothetical protein